MNYKVLDTNIVLLDANHVLTLGHDGSTVVLPQTVVNELDSKKSVPGELGYQVRAFGRLIARGTIQEVQRVEDLVITPILLEDGTMVHITSTNKYPDLSDVDPHTLNDRKIMEIAIQYRNLYSDTTFISNDVMCRITANALGLPCTDLKVTEKTSYEFTKTLEIEDPEVFRTLHKSTIIDVDPEYVQENYNYKFTNPLTMQVKMATINRGVINIIGKETEKELRTQDAPALNSEQLLFGAAIQEPTNDIILCEARAGSGKTVTALSNAIRLVKLGKFRSILYIRGTVNDTASDDEEIGFLSGNEEKLAVYLHALYDSLDFIVRKRLSNSRLKGQDLEDKIAEDTQKLTTECDIQAMVPLGMRGRTFDDSFIIIDEATSISPATMQKILTRVGKNSKVVIIGSQNQIDSKFLTKYNNGMSLVLDAATRPSDTIKIHAINLYKVARSPVCEWAESVFSKEET